MSEKEFRDLLHWYIVRKKYTVHESYEDALNELKSNNKYGFGTALLRQETIFLPTIEKVERVTQCLSEGDVNAFKAVVDHLNPSKLTASEVKRRLATNKIEKPGKAWTSLYKNFVIVQDKIGV